MISFPGGVPAPDDDGFSAFDEQQRRVEEAARSVVAMCRSDQFGRGWRPKGVDEVAILLESLGYSAEVVGELWYPSLFAFASDVAALVDRYVTDEERAESHGTAWFVTACRDYAIGALYSGPWIVAVLGLAAFGAALWSSLSTPLHLATAIALGAYGALVLSGAFSQAIARRLTFYFLQDNATLMAWTLQRFTLAAVLTFAGIGVAGWLVLRQFYGDPDAWLAAAFFTGSGIFQTSLAPLYTMRRFAWTIGVAAFAVLVTGLTFVALFKRRVDVPWEPATLAVEVGAIGLAVMVVTLAVVRRRAQGARSGELVPPATKAILRAALPYGIFGAAYFLAIVADHAAAGLTHGWPYAYNPGYELGCDVALLAIIPIVGVINASLEALPRRILAGATRTVASSHAFDRDLLVFYLRSALAVLAASALTVGIAEWLGGAVLASSRLGLGGADAEVAQFVLRWAAFGYGVLMLALLNCQVLFFLSRPAAAVWGAVAAAFTVIAGSAALIVTGAPAERCVEALDLGIFVFLIVTTVAALGVVRRFTYAYYAAY